MINISSAMAGQFAFAAAELTADIERLGPSPLRRDRGPAVGAGPENQGPTPVGDGDDG
jgi:hypothetical protein